MTVDRDRRLTVPLILPLVEAYLSIPGNEAGGSLHIVLDDGNARLSDAEFCVGWAAERGDRRGQVLARLLTRMSSTQRGKLAAIAGRTVYWADPDAGDSFDVAVADLALALLDM